MSICLGQVSSGCRLLNLCNHTLVVALDCLGGKMPGRQKAWHLRRPLHYLLGRLHLMILHSNHLCIVAGMRWEAFLRSCLLTQDVLMAMRTTYEEICCPLRGKNRHASLGTLLTLSFNCRSIEALFGSANGGALRYCTKKMSQS